VCVDLWKWGERGIGVEESLAIYHLLSLDALSVIDDGGRFVK